MGCGRGGRWCGGRIGHGLLAGVALQLGLDARPAAITNPEGDALRLVAEAPAGFMTTAGKPGPWGSGLPLFHRLKLTPYFDCLHAVVVPSAVYAHHRRLH